MVKCKHYKICGLEADPSTELCVVACKQDDVGLQTATLFDPHSVRTKQPLGSQSLQIGSD